MIKFKQCLSTDLLQATENYILPPGEIVLYHCYDTEQSYMRVGDGRSHLCDLPIRQISGGNEMALYCDEREALITDIAEEIPPDIWAEASRIVNGPGSQFSRKINDEILLTSVYLLARYYQETQIIQDDLIL